MVKAVLFDLDDTLISEISYIESGYQHISKLLSKRLDKDVEELFESLKELFRNNPKNVFNRLLDNNGIPYNSRNIIELVEEYRNHLPNIEFFNDVLPCLEYLKRKNIKIGVITDGYANSQRQKLKAIKAADHFDEIIITDELGREFWKPHPKAFEMMKTIFDVQFSDMVYIGDNVTKDFITPNQLGMKTVRIYRNQGIYNAKNDFYENDYHALYSIKAMSELLDLLK